MFFDDEVTNYILNNYIEKKESIEFNESIKFFNFSFFPNETTNFVELCKNGYLTVIEFLYKSKSFDEELIFSDNLVNAVLKNNHFDIFKFLFEMKLKKSKNDKEFDINKILYSAVENEDVKAVEYLLSKSEIDVNYYYEQQQKKYTYYNNYNTKQKQINKVHNVENKPLKNDEQDKSINKSYKTLLQLAVSKGNNEIISLLLNISNININDQSIDKNYFFYYNDGNHGPDVEVTTKIRTMKSALLIAIENNDIEDVELLIKHPKIDVNDALINEYFYEYNFSDSYNREYAGDVENETETKTALYLAIEQNNPKIVQLLLSHPEIDVNRPSKIILNADDIINLFKSIESDTCEYYPYEHAAVPELEEARPIEIAESVNNIEIISLLLSNPNINADTNKYLNDAIASGNINAFNSILSSTKSDVNEALQGVLHKAVMEGNIDMVNELLNRPEIDVNSVFNNFTAIQIAAQNGNLEVFKALLNKPEIDINTIYVGLTPIVIAAKNNYLEIFNILINHPIIDIKYLFSGQFALNEAAEKGNIDIFKILFENPEIDINFHNQEGYTALHYAVLGGNVEIVKMLLSRPEIDVNVMSHDKTAFQIAVELKNLKIVQIFLERPDVQFDPDTIFPNLDSNQMKIFFLSLSHRKKIENQEKTEIWNQLEEEFYFYFFIILKYNPQTTQKSIPEPMMNIMQTEAPVELNGSHMPMINNTQITVPIGFPNLPGPIVNCAQLGTQIGFSNLPGPIVNNLQTAIPMGLPGIPMQKIPNTQVTMSIGLPGMFGQIPFVNRNFFPNWNFFSESFKIQ